MAYNSAMKRKGLLIPAIIWMSSGDMNSVKEARPKRSHTLWSHSCENPEQADPQRQEAGGGRQGLEEAEQGQVLRGERVSFWGDGHVLELEVMVGQCCGWTKCY